jgi:DNA-binding response OmpR family regulator
MRILVCDDDDVSLTLLCGIVQRMGHEPVPATNGGDALTILLGAHAPQVAMLDWVLPGLDGVGVCKRLREERSLLSTFLIMVTSKRDQEEIVEGLEAGANDYVVKPVHEAELRARLGNAVRLIELQNEVKTLTGLLPICSWCKKIRDASSHWVRLEQYLQTHTDATLTHGGCPDCIAKAMASDPKRR